MELTKKYRLVWNQKRKIIIKPFVDYSGTVTVVGAGRNYYESDNYDDIIQKIDSDSLIVPEE